MTSVSTRERGSGRVLVLAGNYEVECGFCHELVELPAEAMGRTIPCPACGGMLALVSPVPVIPAEPALPAFERLERDRWRPPGLPAARRAKRLHPSWRAVLGGLGHARGAALAAIPLVIILVMTDLFALPLVRPQPLPLGHIEMLAALILLVSLAWHAVGMARAAGVSPFPGSHAARRGLRLQAAAVLVAGGLSMTDVAPLAFAVPTVAGFGLWLLFLNRAARCVDEDDHAIVHDVRTRTRRYCVFLAVAVALYGGALLAVAVKNWHALWMCRAAIGVLAVVFLFDYAALLKAVATAVARRAPFAR